MLKLKAQDEEDLKVISAQMQDALIRVADIKFDARHRTFVLIANRFAWDAQPENERRRTGLHFENVLAVRRKGFHQTAPETILSLLAVSFVETDAPRGMVTLTFAAGHTLQLDVEYLDCSLRDLGPAWAAGTKPEHEA